MEFLRNPRRKLSVCCRKGIIQIKQSDLWKQKAKDNYVLVLVDRTEVKNQQEKERLTIVSDIDDKGNLKTAEALATNQAAFLKFNSEKERGKGRHTEALNTNLQLDNIQSGLQVLFLKLEMSDELSLERIKLEHHNRPPRHTFSDFLLCLHDI